MFFAILKARDYENRAQHHYLIWIQPIKTVFVLLNVIESYEILRILFVGCVVRDGPAAEPFRIVDVMLWRTDQPRVSEQPQILVEDHKGGSSEVGVRRHGPRAARRARLPL